MRILNPLQWAATCQTTVLDCVAHGLYKEAEEFQNAARYFQRAATLVIRNREALAALKPIGVLIIRPGAEYTLSKLIVKEIDDAKAAYQYAVRNCR